MYEFDHHSQEWLSNRHAEWGALRSTCPVAYNTQHGGFWVVSGYEEVAAVSRDGDTFSSRYVPSSEDGIDYIGITGVPRVKGIPQAGIAEVDGPVHQALRRVINPYLLPAAINAMRPAMEQTARWFLDQRIEDGAMDLVLDFTNPVPAVMTMALIGLPCDSWRYYADLFHAAVAYRPSAPEYREAMSHVGDLVGELVAAAGDRRRARRDDLLTGLVELEVEGRSLSDDEIGSVLWNLVGGGLDTTTSLTSLSLHHLATHPSIRRQLITSPESMVTATEEFLRYFSVNETLTRTVTRDVTLAGQEIRRGDHLMLSWLSANWDAREFADAEHVVLDRQPNRHLAFGVGPHRCIGMHMARTLFQVMVGEVLSRIPDFEVESVQFYQGNPELTGVVTMPITFTAGPRLGPPTSPF